MNSTILDIKFPKLAAMLLPMQLRKPRLLAVLSTLASPFSALLAALCQWRSETFQTLKYNGQVCRLEYCLNYRFGDRSSINDPAYARRIRVLDGAQTDALPYVITMRNVEATYERPKRRGLDNQVILHRRSSNQATQYDFIVLCPTEYYTNSQEFAAVVNAYKTQSKKYYVQTT